MYVFDVSWALASCDDDTDVVHDVFPLVIRSNYYCHLAYEFSSTATLVLVLPMSLGPYTMYYEHSQLCLHAVLIQKGRLIAYVCGSKIPMRRNIWFTI